MPKTLIIGLDGASLDLIVPWADNGLLPTFARLMQTGAYGRLRSVMPTVTAAAWPSMVTGLNPGKTGSYDFVRRNAESYRLEVIRREQIAGNPLWRLLGEQGYQVGVINVPLTYPPEPVNGFMVTGLGTPNFKPYTYPEELGKKLTARGYRVNKRESYQPGAEDIFLEEIYEISERLFDCTTWLMADQDWQFLMVVFYDTDQVASYFWKHMDASHPLHDTEKDTRYADAILEYYQRIDEYVGRLIDLAGEDTNVWIVSDHGAGPLMRDIYLNEWLRQQGYLAVVQQKPSWKTIKQGLAGMGITRQNISKILQQARLGKISGWLAEHAGGWSNLLPKSTRPEFFEAVDWDRTYAYSFGFQGQIYINLKGREPNGQVLPGEPYQAICREIIQKLSELVDPQDGKPVVDHIYRKEELFSGPYLDFAPDLLLVMRNLSYFTHLGYEFSDQPGIVIAELGTGESGGHRLDGILFAHGPDIRARGYQETWPNLLDLAPTVLHLMGCPIPRQMDGQVLVDWIHSETEPAYYDSDPSLVTANSHYSEEEQQELIERLKSLGYLD